MVAADDFQLAIHQNKKRQAFQLSSLLDISGQLILHLVFHYPGVDVLLLNLIQRNLGDHQAGTHIIDYFASFDLLDAFALFFCHSFSLLSHS